MIRLTFSRKIIGQYFDNISATVDIDEDNPVDVKELSKKIQEILYAIEIENQGGKNERN